MSAFHKDDPRITAYALAEPTANNSREHTVNATLISHDAELRQEVALVRAFGNELEQAFVSELSVTPRLSDEQQQTIKRTASHVDKPVALAGHTIKATHGLRRDQQESPHKWRMIGAWSLFTTFAAATIAFIIAPVLSPTHHHPQNHVGDMKVTVHESPHVTPAQSELSALTITVEPEITPAFELALPADGDPLDSQALKIHINNDFSNPLTVEEKQENVAAFTQKSQNALAGQFSNRTGNGRTSIENGREEAVANSESGSTGAFMAIGAGGRSAGVTAQRAGRLANDLEALQAIRPDDIASSGETYMQRANNTFYASKQSPLSTFGLDVDAASYANVRRMINTNRLPYLNAVRVEEMINYFPYDIPKPTDDKTFGITVEVTQCPWQPAHQLARIAIRGKSFSVNKRPPLNLVFLIDASGSMGPVNRLPLIKSGLTMLANTLTEQDTLSVITYAGSAQVLLPATNGAQQVKIMTALSTLNAGGSTNGGHGIIMAYEAAHQNFIKDGVNRVILCTDGDFNVGITNRESLVQLAMKHARDKIFLTVLGVGEDNLKDANMEQLADRANGQFYYLDTIAEARKVLIEQISGTLVTIAKDVKAQIEFNPARIAEYRQVGYEKRQLKAQDFNDDKKDAGEIGADHQVTILYELVPTQAAPVVERLRYQDNPPPVAIVTGAHANELMTVKIRFKERDADESQLIQGIITDEQVRAQPSTDQKFASAVAAFALRLRGTSGIPLSWEDIAALAHSGIGSDVKGYRAEFIEMLRKVPHLTGR